MKYGKAVIEAQEQSKQIRRPSWNGTGMHVYVEDMLTAAMGIPGREYPPCFVLVNANVHQMGWIGSQGDHNANDWEVSHDFQAENPEIDQ